MRRRARVTWYVWLVSGTAVLVLDIVAALAPGRWGLGYAALKAAALGSSMGIGTVAR